LPRTPSAAYIESRPPRTDARYCRPDLDGARTELLRPGADHLRRSARRRHRRRRDVNRHHYSPAEIDDALARPDVQRLLALLRWRATEPAFAWSFELLPSTDHVVAVRWSSPASTVTIEVDLASGSVSVDPPFD
jgi:hypothetical protein